jgi:hypothetical protein
MIPMRLPTIIAVCLAGLVSCKESGEVAAPVPSGDGSWPVTKTSDGGGYEVTVMPGGGEITWNKHFSLELDIKSQQPLSDEFELVVDADMPAHRHGMNTKAEVFDQGTSHLLVEGMLFHMKGDWVITVELSDRGVTETVTYPVLIE